MARALKGILTLCLALGLTNIVWGQAIDLRSAVLGPVLSNPDVQKELKLSNEQIDKLKDSLGKVMEKYKDDFAKLLTKSQEEQQKTMKSFGEDTQKVVSEILDAKQWKRFKQIGWQMAGSGALQDPDLQKELKLSDEQKKKLDDIVKDAVKKVQELARNGERSQEKYQAVRKEAEKQADEVLTEEQKKSFKELKGAPFEFSKPTTPKR